MQAAARALLMWEKGPLRYRASRLRINKCLRIPIAPQVTVNLKRDSQGHATSFYRGVCLCGSVWTCPVCAAKISEARRRELESAVNFWKDQGGHLGLLTLTFPHIASDQLGVLLPRFTKALQKFIMWRSGREWANNIGLVHRVRATEFTRGPNGWHPHVHILLFLSKPLEGGNSEKLVKLWQKACVSSGLRLPSDLNGVDLRDGSYAAQYVGKWGVAQELTKANIKHGREGSWTPWDFLRHVLDTGDLGPARPFVEFACATKGTRQLCWSKGARTALQLGQEASDEDLADEEKTPEELVLSTLSLDDWRLVLSAPEGRSRLLDLAERQGEVGVKTFLFSLRN